MGKYQTFLSEEQLSPRGKLKRHLNIVISDPDNERYYLVVPVTTYHEEIKNPNHEQNRSITLTSEDHHFLVHKSYVSFSRARSLSHTEIFNGLNKGKLIRKDDIKPAVLEAIQTAAKKSQFLPEKFLRFLNDNK